MEGLHSPEGIDKIEITLLKSDADSQGDLKQFAESLRASNVPFCTRARTADSAGVEMVILAFIIKVGPEIIKALRDILVEWLKGRNGRRVRLKAGDVEVEASSDKEAEAMVALVEKLKN
jgi:hypothetical protein